VTDTETINLGGVAFKVPRLPLGVNMKAYPLCRELTEAGIVERVTTNGGRIDYDEKEMAKLVDLCAMALSVAEPQYDRAGLESLPATPTELFDAFFLIRYQTGGWTRVPAGEPVGEVQGA
jgi:hypothetical protein